MRLVCYCGDNLPVIMERWMASFVDIPSKTISMDTPNANVSDASDSTPPGTRLCQKDAMVRMGPQKKPKPKIGSTSRKTSPMGSEKLPGHISPNPTLNERKKNDQ